MRRDKLYLSDIIESADEIKGFLDGISRDEFLKNNLIRAAVLQKLTTIGEASARLSDDFRKRHTEVAWADIVGFRNIAVHAYFSVEWSIVWTAATEDAPSLRDQISQIIETDFSQDDE